jgi:threonyl-tRNA synthetase
MPERFELEYVGADNQRHRPVMIHRAILGSVERFLGILIEHYGGDFPLWLAPVQCMLVPVSERHVEYALEIQQKMVAHGLRCDIDVRNEKIGAKIRDAENRKINYMFIVGDNEIENKTLSVRKRKKGNQGEMPVEVCIEKLEEEITRRIYH